MPDLLAKLSHLAALKASHTARLQKELAQARHVARTALTENAQLKADIAAHNKADVAHKHEQRELTQAEKRVDFAAIKSIYDNDAVKLGLTLRDILKTLRKSTLELIERQAQHGLSADFAQSIRLDAGPEFSSAVENYLMDVWRRNRDLALAELPGEEQARLAGLKRFATSFQPDVAGNYFRNRALFLMGVVEDELLHEVKHVIFRHLLGDRSLAQSMDALREVFQEWTGPVADDRLESYKLERVIRTETTQAVNAGRVQVAEAADDFVSGVEISATLDDRTSVTCQLADGLRIPKTHRDFALLTPPLHVNCRSVLVYVTSSDETNWSSEAAIDRVIRSIPKGFQ